eukprot:5657027-Amphidinium_carterae.1
MGEEDKVLGLCLASDAVDCLGEHTVRFWDECMNDVWASGIASSASRIRSCPTLCRILARSRCKATSIHGLEGRASDSRSAAKGGQTMLELDKAWADLFRKLLLDEPKSKSCVLLRQQLVQDGCSR